MTQYTFCEDDKIVSVFKFLVNQFGENIALEDIRFTKNGVTFNVEDLDSLKDSFIEYD